MMVMSFFFSFSLKGVFMMTGYRKMEDCTKKINYREEKEADWIG